MPAETTHAVPVIMPAIGIEPAVVSVWFAEPGELVYEGDRIVEVSAGAATFDVAAPVTGRLLEQRALPRDRLQPGQVLGLVTPNPGS